MVFEEHAQFVAGITSDQIAPREHARHVADRIILTEFEQANAAQSRFRPIAFEAAGRRVPKIDVVHVPDERVLMVMPAEQREIAARIAQCLHFANVLIRTADRLAKPRARSAHVTIQHIAMPCERSRTLHRIRRVCGHFAQAVVELLRRNMLECDSRNRATIAVAPSQLALHLLQPFDRFRRRCAVAVGIGQIPAA